MRTSISTPLDFTEEERLRNNCWLEAAGGRYKGRMYEVGRVDRQDHCVDHYLQQTQTSFNKKVDSEEIVELRQQLSTNEEQIRHMNSQFQSFHDLMIQYLSPEVVAVAQHIFQQLNTQQLSTQQNHIQDNDQVQ